MTNIPAPIPKPESAPLPAKYEAARLAIAECERIDECKTWADKAAALASYAKQAKDDSLRQMAVRIQARAERRAGELLRQINPGHGARDGKRRDGTVPPLTRGQAAKDAGLSERQRKTALRIANIPISEFERQIESERPPTVSHLAAQGVISKAPLITGSLWQAIECEETRGACETLERFAGFCERCQPTTISRAVCANEAESVKRLIAISSQWLAQLASDLNSDSW